MSAYLEEKLKESCLQKVENCRIKREEESDNSASKQKPGICWCLLFFFGCNVIQEMFKVNYIKGSFLLTLFSVSLLSILFSVCPCLVCIAFVNWLYFNSSMEQRNFIRASMSVCGQGQMITHCKRHATLPP